MLTVHLINTTGMYVQHKWRVARTFGRWRRVAQKLHIFNHQVHAGLKLHPNKKARRVYPATLAVHPRQQKQVWMGDTKLDTPIAKHQTTTLSRIKQKLPPSDRDNLKNFPELREHPRKSLTKPNSFSSKSYFCFRTPGRAWKNCKTKRWKKRWRVTPWCRFEAE